MKEMFKKTVGVVLGIYAGACIVDAIGVLFKTDSKTNNPNETDFVEEEEA